MKSLIDKANVLAEALPYMQRFKNAIIVIKFGGSTMENDEVIDRTMRDIVLLETIGLRPVVVHGGGKAISARLKQLEIPTTFVDGLRYTCPETIKVVDDVLHNTVNTKLIEQTQRHGGAPCPISGKDVLLAKKLIKKTEEQETEYGYVGEVIGVDPTPILEALKKKTIPIMTPLAQDANGQPYNINADVAACKMAQALKATKLVFLSDVPGILKDPNDESSLIPTIYMREVEDYIKAGIISGGMIPKVRSAIDAIGNGVKKVHMIDGRISHALLLEIFTDSGVGTEIFRWKGSELPPHECPVNMLINK